MKTNKRSLLASHSGLSHKEPIENEINMCGRNGNYRVLVEAKVWSLPAVNMQNLMQSVSKIYTYIHVRFDAINCKKTSRDFEIRAFMYICIYNMYECMKQLQMAA